MSFSLQYNEYGELPVATVAGQLGLAYTLSTAGSQPIEDVAKANDNGVKTPLALPVVGAKEGGIGKAIRWYQLYASHDMELTESILKRAHDSGFTACMYVHCLAIAPRAQRHCPNTLCHACCLCNPA
jgi:isopentenyl diphosphate isomerase/L-lactate dehydrogenase-like FMN-dependent dehydrogenase